MTPEEKAARRREFQAFAAALPPLTTSVLASMYPPGRFARLRYWLWAALVKNS